MPNDAIKINTYIEDDKLLCCTPALFKYINNMEDFETGVIEIDSELIGQDLDDIDPFAEFTDVEEEPVDDGGILYE